MACATLKRTLDFDPLHSPGTSPKRRRCSPIITPSTPTSRNSLQQSPFSPVTPRISPGQLAAHISQEWRRIKRRKRLEDSYSTESPVSSEMMEQASRFGLTSGCFSPPSTSTNPMPNLPSGSLQQTQTKDQPMFTLKQVILICERMLKEQESRIREEYDKALTCKLAEQYDAFVKFNQDQIQRRFTSTSMSYVS
ncbi:akirin-2-like [Lytechinus pictus]|uniref:akirin-2-like n=1 Tax=Lytechinus pictus TaxID=7653 RepID=UPI00240D5794|nr:akirin-2-like [Lytechinus pictus]